MYRSTSTLNYDTHTRIHLQHTIDYRDYTTREVMYNKVVAPARLRRDNEAHDLDHASLWCANRPVRSPIADGKPPMTDMPNYMLRVWS